MSEDLLTLEVLRLRRIIDELVSADPDYGQDIKEFYTNSIYADMSDGERDVAVTDRMIEHQEVLKAILAPPRPGGQR